jgi:hypothetical protein
MSRRAVWKYPISLDGGITRYQIPEGARLLHCAEQAGSICLWFEVRPDEIRTQQRAFRIFGTGDAAIDDHLTYVGTALLSGGSLVFHVYEVTCP